MKRSAVRSALLAALLALPVAAGCAPPTPAEPGPTTLPPPAGTNWRLQSLGATGTLRPVLTTVGVTLEFSDDQRVSGGAGCNSYFGQYARTTDGALSVSRLGSTKMFCREPGVMQQEQDFLNALAAAERYTVTDGLLRISGGSMAMVFAAL